MKKLYLIGGTMGVGKTTVCRALKNTLPDSVFLDGDWCWDAHPFKVTDETKEMVMKNICFLLNSFLHCSAYKNVIFCWVMHEQEIIDTILKQLDTADCAVKTLSLVCTPETLQERLLKDIADGLRSGDVLDRSLARIPYYERLTTEKIGTDGKTPEEIAGQIAAL